MKGIRRRALLGLAVLLAALVPAAWGAVPQDALSAKPAGAIYSVFQVDDLGNLARSILSSENIDLFAPLLDKGEVEGFRIVAAIVSKMPVKTTALLAGTDENLTPFLQLALSLPAELKPQLDLVASGKAKPEDIVSLTLGDGAVAFGPLLNVELQKGPQGPYFLLNSQAALAARDGLLLVGLSPADLEASLKALADPKERLSVKRRHESRNFSLLHLDFPTLIKMAGEQQAKEKADKKGGKKIDEIDLDALKKYFKAPLEIEYGIDKDPGSVLFSMGVNIEEALNSAYLERFAKMDPVPGGEIFLAGGGRPLFALSSKLSFKGSDLDIYPEIAKLWKDGIKQLAQYGITESEVENLLSGSVSLVCGGSAAVAGAKMPGAYLALTGREGAASSIFKKVTESAKFAATLPTAPVDVKGWEMVLQVDPSLFPFPVPILFGVKGETLFVGVQDAAGLNTAPEISGTLKALLEKGSLSTSFFDFEAIRAFLDGALSDKSSPLYALAEELPRAILDSVKDVLGAELSVPFVGSWAPRMDEAFVKFSLVDVPAGKGLMAKIVKAAAQYKAKTSTPATASATASGVVSDMRSLKAACLLLYADNVDEDLTSKINKDGVKLLHKYLDNPNKFPENGNPATFEVKNGEWWISYKVDDLDAMVREKLAGRAAAVGLFKDNSGSEPYEKSAASVFMRVR
nr:hypothetical protein [uncultured Fretibacterium sp.]